MPENKKTHVNQPQQPDKFEDRKTPDVLKPRQKRSWLRRMIGAVIAVIVIVIILIILAPTILSTSAGNGFLLSIINSNISGTLKVKRISFGWFSGPVIKGAQLYYPKNTLIVDMPSANLSGVSPLGFLFGSRDFGKVNIQVNKVSLTQKPGEPTNLQLALQPPSTDSSAADHRQPPDAPAPSGSSAMALAASANLHFTAKSITYQSPGLQKITLSNVKADLDTANLQKIKLSINSNLSQGNKTGHVAAQATLVDLFSSQGQLQWRQGQIQDGAVDLKNIPIVALDRLMKKQGQLTALLGTNLNAAARVQGPLQGLMASISARSENMNLSLQLKSTKSQVSISKASFALLLTPKAFNKLMQPKPAQGKNSRTAPVLLQPVKLNVVVNQLKIPRQKSKMLIGKAALDIQAAASNISILMPNRGKIGLNNTQLNITAAQLGQKITATLSALSQYQNIQKPVNVKLQVSGAVAKSGQRKIQLEANALPITLADALTKSNGKLVKTIGKTLSVSAAVSQKTKADFAFNAQISSANLNGALQGRWNIKSRQGRLTTPKVITLKLTPQSWDAWMSESNISLISPALIHLKIDKLQLALQTPPPGAAGFLSSINPKQTSIAGSVTIPKLIATDTKTRQSFAITDARLQIPKGNTLSQAIKLILSLKASDLTTGQQNAPTALGTATLNAKISSLTGPNNTIGFKHARVVGNGEINNMPSSVASIIGAKGSQLASLLGNKTNAAIAIDYKLHQGGAIVAKVKSTNVTTDINAAVKDGIVRLNKDATLHMKVTPQVSQVLLKNINPLLGSAVGAKMPIDIHIDQKGFAVPVKNFSIQKLTLNGGVKPFNVMLVPGKSLSQLFGVLRMAGVKIPTISGQQLASISDIGLHIANGKLSYTKPMYIAFGSGMALGFTGGINLQSKKLDMNISFKGNKFDKYGLSKLVLPVSGTVNHMEFNQKQLVDSLMKSYGNNLIQKGLKSLFGK